jgi:hypothetical protein
MIGIGSYHLAFGHLSGASLTHSPTHTHTHTHTHLATNFTSTFNCINKTGINNLDEELQGKVKQYNTEDLIHDCFSCVTAACKAAFRIYRGRKLKTRRTVPWWNNELKILQKEINAL